MTAETDAQWGNEEEGTICVPLEVPEDPWGSAESAAWRWLTQSDGTPLAVAFDPVVAPAPQLEPAIPVAITVSRTKTPVVDMASYQPYIAASSRRRGGVTRPIPVAVTAALLVPTIPKR